jgi:chromosome segregation and condensation protein ScpB
VDQVTADPDALERVVAAGRDHPRCTMLIAQQAHVALVEQSSHQLDLAAAERGYRGAMAAERARHADALLDARRFGTGAVRVLSNLAYATPTYRALEPKAARRALDALAVAGIVSRGTRRGEWSITDPLFADYLAGVLPHP